MTRYKMAAVGALTAALVMAPVASAIAGRQRIAPRPRALLRQPALSDRRAGCRRRRHRRRDRDVALPDHRRRRPGARTIRRRKVMARPATPRRPRTTRPPQWPMHRRRRRTITGRPRPTMRRGRSSTAAAAIQRLSRIQRLRREWRIRSTEWRGRALSRAQWRQLRAAAGAVRSPEWQLQLAPPAFQRLQHALGYSGASSPDVPPAVKRKAAPLPDRKPAAPVRRRGGRPSRDEAARLSDRILDAATDLFFQRGYGATSIEAVARSARISKRTFYHRYATRRRSSAPSSTASSRDCGLPPPCRSSPARISRSSCGVSPGSSSTRR